MSHCPSLLVAEAWRSIETLATARCGSERQRQRYQRHLERLRVAIDQFSRIEVYMSDYGKVIKFERERAERAEAKVAELSKTQPDAEDAEQLKLGLADIEAANAPAPSPETASA